MLNIVVIDDNKLHREKICRIISNKINRDKNKCNIYEFADAGKNLVKYIKENSQKSVYFIDLELPKGDGIDIARLIRNEYNDWISPIIVITAHSSLYYEVYKQRYQVLDFISKFNDARKNIEENLDICYKILNQERIYRYVYKNVDYSINFLSIDYIKRDGRQIVIVTDKEDYYQNISITDINKLLPSYFIISAKGIIINMKNIVKIDWNNCIAYFKDGKYGYLVSKTHKKEISSYEHD